MTILVTIVAIYLSYIAENGLPFVPTYNVNVDVSNASELTKNAPVRIGSAQVGQVLTITPELPARTPRRTPYARLGLALQKSVDPLPANSHYQVRLRVGARRQVRRVVPGRDPDHPGEPDGGTDLHQSEPQHPVRRPRRGVRHLRPEDPAGNA